MFYKTVYLIICYNLKTSQFTLWVGSPMVVNMSSKKQQLYKVLKRKIKIKYSKSSSVTKNFPILGNDIYPYRYEVKASNKSKMSLIL